MTHLDYDDNNCKYRFVGWIFLALAVLVIAWALWTRDGDGSDTWFDPNEREQEYP